MKSSIAIISLFLSSILYVVMGFAFSEEKTKSRIDLVKTSTWFIAGPVNETQETINAIRKEKGIVRVTAKENPIGEIELNVMITESDSNDGAPTNLSQNSKYVSITYKSNQLIKLQAREGNAEGTGCVHGGSHPRVDLPISEKFTTIKIPWTNFRQDGNPNGKLLNVHNLCKFNFVNYNPSSGAILEIKSVIIE
ncbi:hypothetical protein J0383_16280 [Flavobacterium endoglycinae]|uniref:NADH:ubiquinone oxidoreductase intermediate-associated protein 30 domain-containing protein n=1 Tax=Flavobacterium endoglycinae TaxID=2816357 RepID=A0ABX7QAY6_9FLAO|nr:hypothetical protein [Flavobacterium endoglycinae]QSW87824.1 hypothetical protein J0383_16280 [Flavobacterium endoglycinae]